MRKIIFLVCALVSFVKCQTYSKFQYSTCDTSSPAFTIQEMDFSPMPLVLGTQATGVLQATSTRGANSPFIDKFFRVQIMWNRKIQGLTLPIRCFLITGNNGPVFIGSCTYEDFCKTMETMFYWNSSGECPQFILDAGFNCSCPFNFSNNYLNYGPTSFTVHDFISNDYWAPFQSFMSGDLDINIKMSDGPTLENNRNYFGCLNIKFSLKYSK